jgi:hypothetical protein
VGHKDPLDAPSIVRIIERLEQELERTKEQHIRANGWKISCSSPGSHWFWYIVLDDGRWTCRNVDEAYTLQLRIETWGR